MKELSLLENKRRYKSSKKYGKIRGADRAQERCGIEKKSMYCRIENHIECNTMEYKPS